MAVTLERIYEIAMRDYQMKLLAGEKGLGRLTDWVHVVEEADYIAFLKGRELIITTGIARMSKEEMLDFVQKIYEADASGLIINVGRYLPHVPSAVIRFAKEKDFPIFTLPWEVHLVEFNREICNLIYQSEQAYDTLDGAVKKVIFHPRELEQCMPFFRKEGITERTPLRLIQCYFPNTDITRIYGSLLRFCQQMLSNLRQDYVMFHYDLYVTLVLLPCEEERVRKAAEEIVKFLEKKKVVRCLAVSDAESNLGNLHRKYKNMALLCRKNQREDCACCYEEEQGIWKMFLEISKEEWLRKYEQSLLGNLERMDQEQGTEYCRILETYLNENGNIQEVAVKCFLHRNTVTYQLKKIGEITGKQLNDAKDRNELYVAFQIRTLLELL